MPVNEQSTVEEVEEYFAKFAQTFRTQVKTKETGVELGQADN